MHHVIRGIRPRTGAPAMSGRTRTRSGHDHRKRIHRRRPIARSPPIGAALDAALDTSDADVDWSFNDGILEIDCGDGGKLIVNRHVPNREIWVAARSGGVSFQVARRSLARHALGRRARGGARRARARAGRIDHCAAGTGADGRSLR